MHKKLDEECQYLVSLAENDLEKNKDYITSFNVNEKQFYDYVEYIKNPDNFDLGSKFKKVILPQADEEEIDEDSALSEKTFLLNLPDEVQSIFREAWERVDYKTTPVVIKVDLF